MSNIQIESDLKEILNKLDGKLDSLQKDVTGLKVGQAEVKGDIKRLDSNISTIKEDIKEIKGSQKAQIWTLIGVLITAVGGFIVAVGRSLLSFNP
ncbi:MAG: hemolysin XhlA family protein [Waterburya sp.]